MSMAIEGTIQVLQVVLQTVPIGTNLALLQLLWSILSGSLSCKSCESCLLPIMTLFSPCQYTPKTLTILLKPVNVGR